MQEVHEVVLEPVVVRYRAFPSLIPVLQAFVALQSVQQRGWVGLGVEQVEVIHGMSRYDSARERSLVVGILAAWRWYLL